METIRLRTERRRQQQQAQQQAQQAQQSSQNNNNNAAPMETTPTATTEQEGMFTQQEYEDCFDPQWPPNALALAHVLRMEGNESFREGDYTFSFSCYNHAIGIR